MIDARERSRILVVNEDHMVLDLIAGILRNDASIEVRCARGTREGQAAASEMAPDLVICPCRDAAGWVGFLGRMRHDDAFPSPLLLLLGDGAGGGQERGSGDTAARGPAPQCPDDTGLYSQAPLSPSVKNALDGADDYIELSLCRPFLRTRISALVGARRLQEELKGVNERLAKARGRMERYYAETTAISLKVLEVSMPGAGDRAREALDFASFIAARLGLPVEKRKKLEFAALFHEIGKVGLPDGLMRQRYHSLPEAQRAAYRQYALIGATIVADATPYRESADAICHQLENYDGSGFPDGLLGEEIPSGARVLRAVVLYERFLGECRSMADIVEGVRLSMHSVLDQRIANLLIEFLGRKQRKGERNTVKLGVDELKPGMVIAEDVYAGSGVKLLAKGVRLLDKTLGVLLERNETDPIVGGVCILTDWSLLDGDSV
ncbi:MAG: HD domain-containing phosphohydrolase [Syntrophorhabdales bacterium]|jgi:response regulator RpfG family c-di-GMP phosphodiesterase